MSKQIDSGTGATLDARSAGQQAEARQYERERLTVNIVSMVVQLAFMAYMVLHGGLVLDIYVRPLVHGHRWMELWAFSIAFGAALFILSIPFDVYGGFVLEHKYGMSTQSIGGWLAKQAKITVLGGIFGLLLLSGLYALLWAIPNWWWLAAGLAWLGINVVLGQLFPVLIVPLFYKLTPISDERLLERFRSLAEGTGIRIKDILRLSLSQETKKANAALAGLGHTKRVLMGDTLLENFSDEEIDAVFMHELGHSVLAHVPKGIAMSGVIGLAGFFFCDVAMRASAHALGYPSFTAVSAMPLFLFVLTIFTLVMTPFEKGVTRMFERQADWYSLESTKNPTAFVSAFQRLAELNKAQLNPSRIVVLLFYTHPPIAERIAMADRWRSQNAA